MHLAVPAGLIVPVGVHLSRTCKDEGNALRRGRVAQTVPVAGKQVRTVIGYKGPARCGGILALKLGGKRAGQYAAPMLSRALDLPEKFPRRTSHVAELAELTKDNTICIQLKS
jgi:hypothetical protein